MTIIANKPNLFTEAEFQRVVRSGGFGDARVELRRGMIVKTSPQYPPHARAKMALTFAFSAMCKEAGLRWQIWNEVSVSFGGGFEPLPDIVIFDPAGLDPNFDGPVPAAAVKLIVEVSDSTLADDLGEKLQDYAGCGLTEYWVADVKGRLLLQHTTPEGDRYLRRETRSFGEMIEFLSVSSLKIDSKPLAG